MCQKQERGKCVKGLVKKPGGRTPLAECNVDATIFKCTLKDDLEVVGWAHLAEDCEK
jgi:hypothetical protein